jgi:hypothetical protein
VKKPCCGIPWWRADGCRASMRSVTERLLVSHCIGQLLAGHIKSRVQLACARDHTQHVRHILELPPGLGTTTGRHAPPERLAALDELPQERRTSTYHDGHLRNRQHEATPDSYGRSPRRRPHPEGAVHLVDLPGCVRNPRIALLCKTVWACESGRRHCAAAPPLGRRCSQAGSLAGCAGPAGLSRRLRDSARPAHPRVILRPTRLLAGRGAPAPHHRFPAQRIRSPGRRDTRADPIATSAAPSRWIT